MYPLDQVIRFLEQRQQTEDWSIRDAAIAYLKGYREILPEYSQMKLDAVNAPLTWEELQEMKQKPVWVETEKFGNHWYLIEDINRVKVEFVGAYHEMVQFYRGDFNTSWNAYRKEKRTS